MRFFKFLITLAVVVVGLGYGLYYFGTNIASEKIMSAVSSELESSGQIDTLKKELNQNPALKELVEEGANIEESQLPFTTKEQATRVLIKKIGLGELQSLQSQFQNGISQNEMLELINKMSGKLTDEEILAIKVIAYKELNK
ncbi:hypothetical protein [Sporosarcina sp. FA9]|uniref:hypothetical protein n=1 Tax=Sporosarcina sp. FA9 TaxID=3413030 RepID=UPI003F65A6A3